MDNLDVVGKETFSLEGHLDGRRSAEVRAALYDHIEQHSERDIVVDLSRVESIDVTTLRLLAAAGLRLERVGRRIVLRGCSPAMRRLFAYSGWRRLVRLERAAAPGEQRRPE